MFDGTLTIEPQGLIQDSLLGAGGGGGQGQYVKHKVFSCERRRREAMLGVIVMYLAHFHTPKMIPIYTQGRSNEFES